MKLLLVQHGEAKSREDDPDRSLTEEGIQRTKIIATWLGRQHFDIREIYHSGKKRAAQTAEIFANRLAPAKGIAVVPGLNPNDDVHAFTAKLGKSDGALVIVGHLPFLDRFASLLVTGDPNQGVVLFTNSGVVCLVERKPNWSVAWAVVPELLIDAK